MTRPTPGILAGHEARAIADAFGVSDSQVRLDHTVSHVLAAIATIDTDRIVFFGGTALSRTHLAGLRLSEDVDLVALGDRTDIATQIERAITQGIGRTLGTPTFVPHLRHTQHPQPSVVSVAGVKVQVQLLSAQGYPPWPTEVVTIDQRYSDAPPARLRVLTSDAFAAAKLSAWHDRAAPRDLYDMWGMADRGLITEEAARLFSRHGPLTQAAQVSFDDIPTDTTWNTVLGNQCIPQVTAYEAAHAVRRAWNAWPPTA